MFVYSELLNKFFLIKGYSKGSYLIKFPKKLISLSLISTINFLYSEIFASHQLNKNIMKKLFIPLSLFSVIVYQGQIGINTSNPQNIFHVDGGKDNSPTLPPSALEQANDFIIDNEGNIGVGTILPSVKLEINAVTNGAIKIADGTQGESKVLTSDANGIGSWQTPASIRPTYMGVYPTSNLYVTTDGTSTPVYTSTYVDLTQGKWIMSAGITLTNGVPDTRIWVQAFLSSSSTSISTDGFTHLGPAGASTAYAGALTNSSTGVNSVAGDGSLNLLTGNIIINVTDPTARIYLLIENGTPNAWSYTSSSYENYFYATPVN